MRTITIAGCEFEIRPLKRKEIKDLKKKGINLADLKPQNADDALDAVFEMMFNKEQIAAIDEMDHPQARELWMAILKETYGAGDEEKN